MLEQPDAAVNTLPILPKLIPPLRLALVGLAGLKKYGIYIKIRLWYLHVKNP